MRAESTPSPTARVKHSWQTSLIAVSCGMIAAVVTYFVGRAAGFEYWREAGMAMFYLVAVPVGAYRDGRLKTRPTSVIAFAVIAAGVSALLVGWGREWAG